jgi:bifunctional DNA primase/polymerase-like protein
VNALLDAALEYANLRWPVHPLVWAVDGICSCSEGPACTQTAKHPLTEHGLKDATVDPDVIRSWWKRWPDANVGLRTGIAFDALDIDSTAAGWSLAVMAEAASEVTATCWGDGPMSITSRGSHLLYLPTGARGTSNLVVPHVDWRGTDGYIVAPPSIHASGHVYHWHPGNGPETPLELAPAFLIVELFPPTRMQKANRDMLISTRSAENVIAGIVRVVAEAPEGERNNTLNWAAHKIGLKVYAGEIEQNDALDALEQIHNAAINNGLGEREVERSIESGWSDGHQGRTKSTA